MPRRNGDNYYGANAAGFTGKEHQHRLEVGERLNRRSESAIGSVGWMAATRRCSLPAYTRAILPLPLPAVTVCRRPCCSRARASETAQSQSGTNKWNQLVDHWRAAFRRTVRHRWRTSDGASGNNRTAVTAAEWGKSPRSWRTGSERRTQAEREEERRREIQCEAVSRRERDPPTSS